MKLNQYRKYNKRFVRSVAINKAAKQMPDLAAQTPILITGTHRSGTTVIGTLLAESDAVRYVYEPLNPKDGVYMSKDDFGLCKVCGVRLPTYFLKITKQNEQDYIAHFKHLMNAKVMLGKRPLLKSPFTMFAAEWLHHRYGAKNIVLIRSPLGFVSSLKKMEWDDEIDGLLEQPDLLDNELAAYKKDIKKYGNRDKHTIVERGAIMWKAIYGHAAELQKQYPHWLFVRLEDFQNDPVPVIEKMYEYTGLEFTDAVKQKTLDMTGTHNPGESSVPVVHSIKRNAKKAAKTWKGRLTDEEIKTVQDIVGDKASLFYSKKELQ